MGDSCQARPIVSDDKSQLKLESRLSIISCYDRLRGEIESQLFACVKMHCEHNSNVSVISGTKIYDKLFDQGNVLLKIRVIVGFLEY